MTKHVNLGFLQPSQDSIQVKNHQIKIGDQLFDPEVSGPSKWGYEIPVLVQFLISADRSKVLTQCGLPNQSKVGIAITWHSSKTNKRGATHIQELIDGDQQLTIELPGPDIGGQMKFRVSVILIENPTPESTPLAPTIPGARLWEAQMAILLDGTGAQFPISAINFKDVGLPEGAMWHLEVTINPERHVSGAIRLLLNEQHPRVKQYISDPTADPSQDFRKFMFADIDNQLLVVAMHMDPHDLEEYANEASTLAEALVSLHTIHFGNQPIDETRRQYEEDPGSIFSTVQANHFASR